MMLSDTSATAVDLRIALEPLSTSEKQIALSIVIPTHGRAAALERCLASILAADLPLKTEIIVVCNGSDPATEDLLKVLSTSDQRIRVIAQSAASPAGARNSALTRARGEIVYFLDDDVTIAPDLFSRALDTFSRNRNVDVLGGPNLTPAMSSPFEQSAGLVLASPFGSASVRARYRSIGKLRSTDDRSLILCNLAIRRRALAGRNQVFDSHLVCNEENLLLGELKLKNSLMLHDPRLIVYHSRRSTLFGFARQIFKYGRGRWQNTVALPRSLSLIYLIPSLFLIYLLLLPFASFAGRLVPLALYGLLLLVCAAYEAYRVNVESSFPRLLLLFPICHLAYGAGVLYQFVLWAASFTAKSGSRKLHKTACFANQLDRAGRNEKPMQESKSLDVATPPQMQRP